MVKLSIHQPCYLPYLGVFYKMYQADQFVFLDDAQFSTGYVFNWNTIKTPQGTCRLKIPVDYNFGDNINQVMPRYNLGWVEKHLKTIYMNYRKAKHFDEFYPELESVLHDLKDSNLSTLNIALFLRIAELFGIMRPCRLSSSLQIHTKKEQRVIDICKAMGADVYISGHGASAYQEEEHFTEAGIELTYTDYKPIKYGQIWGNFKENMSVIDYIFNCGYDWDGVLAALEV